MKRGWKRLLAIGMAAGLSVCAVFPALAGEWKHLEGGESWQWWYEEADGSYTVSDWQQINGVWYHFDSNGYLDIGWKFLDNKWYFLEDSGAMAVNKAYDGGHLDASGQWVSDIVPPDNMWSTTEEEDAYWTAKQAQYGISSSSFKDNGDGSYTLTCEYNSDTVLPMLYDVIYATAAYRFNGYNYNWKAGNYVFTFTVSDVGSY